MASTLVRGTREGLCKKVALRSGLKDEKMPALGRGTRVQEVGEYIPFPSEKQMPGILNLKLSVGLWMKPHI